MKTVNQAPEHPSNEDLAAFALGKTTSNAETIAEHIANCARCETLLNKTPKDTFLGILNKAKPGFILSEDSKPRAAPPTGDELPSELQKQTKYKFLKKLGGGGMGVVWLAEHNLMKRKVAVKLIPPELIGNPAIKERFLQEVVSAAALEHPNVVRAYATEEFGQYMIFEMEFVDGKDLGEIVKSKGPLSVVHAVNYIRQAAQALQHGMLKSLVHRDIKPGNLMLTRAGSVKVADFGLAKFNRETDKNQNRSLTGVDSMMGTPDYMAPEQARNAKAADIRADIYSLGCTFYYLLTGRPPFEGASITDLIFKHWEEPRPDVSQLRDDVPPELSQFIQKMMAKDPNDRPQSPKEVVDGLTKFTKPEPKKKESLEKSNPRKEKGEKLPAVESAAESPPVQKKKGRMVQWVVLAASIVFLAASAFVVLQWKARKGILVLETEIPNPIIRVVGEEKLIVEALDGGREFRLHLKAGKEYQIVLEKEGYEPSRQNVLLKEGEQTIAVKWVKAVFDHTKLKPGQEVEYEIAKGVRMKFCWIPPGEAQLGSPATEAGRFSDEEESHRGKFKSKGFWLAKYPVTQEEYEAIAGGNPSHFSTVGDGKDKVVDRNTKRLPVENVTWKDAQNYVEKLNDRADGTEMQSIFVGKAKFALPHENEWEYACRGGKGNEWAYYFGDEIDASKANYRGNIGRTTEVGTYEKAAPHPWGLCDMCGNVWQWCDNLFNGARIYRGGGWNSEPRFCRSAIRGYLDPRADNRPLGFRVAATMP